MLRVPSHLPHDDHLCFQQRSYGVVVRQGGAIVCENNTGLRADVGSDAVAERLRGKAESMCAVSTVIMKVNLPGW